jgi:hypothetical protein
MNIAQNCNTSVRLLKGEQSAPQNATNENVARKETMNSIDLLDLVNAARLEFGESEVRRSDFTARCKDELSGEYYETFVVHNLRGPASEALTLTLDQCMLVSMRESKSVRRTVLQKLKDIEKPRELSRMDLIQLALAAEQEKLQIAAERDQAVATKAEIGSRREATAMATASSAVKRVNKLLGELGRNAKAATVIAVENAGSRNFGSQGFRPLKKWCTARGISPDKVPCPRFGYAVAWPAQAWLDCYDIDLSVVFGGEA